MIFKGLRKSVRNFFRKGKNNRRKRKPNQAVDGESSGSGNTDEHPTIPLSKVQFHEHSHQSAETSNNTAEATTTEGTETNQPSNDHQLVGDGGLVEPLHVADINIDAEGKKHKENGGGNQAAAAGPSGAVSTGMSPSSSTQASGADNTEHPTPARNDQSPERPLQSATRQPTETCNDTADATTEAVDTNQPADDHQLVGDVVPVETPKATANNMDKENPDIDISQKAGSEKKEDEIQQQDTSSSGYGSSVTQSASQSSNDLSEGRSRASTLEQQEKQGGCAESDETFSKAQVSEDSPIQFSSNIDAVEEEKIKLTKDTFPSFDDEHFENKTLQSHFEIELEGKTYRLRTSSCGDSSEYDDTDGESDSDGGNSSDNDLDEELPQDLIDKITSLCDDRDVDYVHLTHKHRQVTLYGEGVSSIDGCLKMYVKENHHNLNINTCEQSRYSSIHEYAGKFSGEVKVIQLIAEKDKSWEFQKSATCGIILAGIQKNVSKPEQALYAVIPAHLPISTSHCIEICKANPSMDMSDIEDRLRMTSTARYELHVHNRKLKIDLVDHPMAVYEEYFKKEGQNMEGSNMHKKFSKDMAIVKLDPTKLADDPGLLQEIRNAMSQKKLSSGHPPKMYKIGEVLPIKYPKDLIKLLVAGIDIKVGNFDGRSFFAGPQLDLKSNKRQRAFAFTFRTNGHQLVRGNSGSTVYAVDAKEDMLYPLGILTGEEKVKPPCGTTVYSAALFAPNLQHIEEKYGNLYASDLKSISTNDEGALDLKEMIKKLRNTKKLKPKQKSTARPPAAVTPRMDKIDDKICNTRNKDSQGNSVSFDSGFETSTSSSIDQVLKSL